MVQRNDTDAFHNHADAPCELFDKVLAVGVIIYVCDDRSGGALSPGPVLLC